jgi:hypothetical protein
MGAWDGWIGMEAKRLGLWAERGIAKPIGRER